MRSDEGDEGGGKMRSDEGGGKVRCDEGGEKVRVVGSE